MSEKFPITFRVAMGGQRNAATVCWRAGAGLEVVKVISAGGE